MVDWTSERILIDASNQLDFAFPSCILYSCPYAIYNIFISIAIAQ